MRFWVSSTCIALVTWGCGPKPEAKAPPPQAVEAPATVVAEAPDLSPVKRPPEVVALGRIARPRVLVDTFTKWSSLPVTLDDLLPEPAKPLSKAVLWDAPIDAVVALDNFGEGKLPRPLMIGSVGLKSLEAALSAADAMQLPTRKLTAGVYRFGDSPDVSCVAAMSLGTAPARLVCGYGPKDVDTLLPYATRGLPTEPQSGSDFEITLDAGPVQERYGRDVTALRLFAGMAIREVALDSPRFDRALSDAVYGVVDDTINLFNDLDRIRIEAHVDAARNVLVGSTELKLKGQSSWLAGTLAATKPQAIPADLPRLPAGATLAAYNPALPSERYAAIARILGELGEGWLEHEKFPEAARKRARHLVDAMFSSQPESFAFAMSPTQTDAIGYRHSDTMVVRASEPAPRMLGVYSDFFSLLGDPGLKNWIKQKAKLKMNDKVAGAVTKLWPKLTKKPFKLAGFKTPATLFEVTVDLKAWSEVDETVARAIDSVLKGETKELKRLDIIVQPDGDHTWIITGDDTKEMARVVAEQQKSGPGAFFARPQHDQKVALAGFVTLSYAAHAIARSAKNEKIIQAFSGAPHRGETPITFASSVGPGSVHVDVEVPADAFSDITAAAIRGGADLKDALNKAE